MSGGDNNYVFEDLYGTMIRVENKVRDFYVKKQGIKIKLTVPAKVARLEV